MAFTEGFEYDIFISYAHPDNSAPEEKKGWVDDFHEELEASLVRRFGYNKIAVWRDKNLSGNTRFDNRIKKVINHSALFLALVSPHYLDSDYCRQELEWFYNQAKSSRFGLSVKDEYRLFNILLKNIPHTSWPKEFSGTSGFSMHDAPGKSDEPGEPIYPDDGRFRKELREIVDAIEKTLKDFPRSTIHDSTGDTEQETVRIFIADTADTLQTTRDRLIADLEGKNLHIPDPIPPPMKNKEHESSAAEAIEKANLTVHLLDELPGREIIDCKATTYPRRQLEIALHSDTSQLIWIPRYLHYENVEDEDYRTFLQSLENGAREEKKYQFIRSKETDLADLILEKITQIQKEKRDEADYASILLDTHQKDQLFAFNLAQYLGSKGIKIEFNQESRDPLSSLQNFEKYLQHVRNLVIIFGQVTPAWVLERLKKAINIIETQLKDVNKKVLKNLWVYLLPSSQITGGISHLVKEHGIKLLDNSHSDRPDERVVERLLTSDRELRTCLSTHKNPFVGLRPFESTDSLYYFGRDEQTGALLQYLYHTRFLAVVGSSGSGKSSLVRAGLIPHLEAGFLVQDRDLWHIAKMKPGDQPLYNLAHALVHAVEDKPSAGQIADFAETIRHKGIRAVLERIAPMLAANDSNLFILVDQFEEVFRFGVKTRDSAKQEEAAAFVDLLLRLAGQEDIPVYVCLTMRSDYIGDCNVFNGLPEAMNRSQYLIPRLTRRQRHEAIEGPIRLAGAAIAPRLLDRLLNDSGEYRDDLPILQHALMRTWNEWAKQADGPVDMIHYEKIQTMEHALSQHADEALNKLADWEKYLAKRLFQTLTETDAENRRIRRSAHLNEIADVLDAPPATVMRIIGKFREDSRSFLVLSSETTEDNPLVDISHESLMRQWGTLGNWMDEETESAKIYKRLAETAELYKQGKAGLYTGLDLQIALDWKEREKPIKAWGKRYYKHFEEVIEFLNKSNIAHQEIYSLSDWSGY